MKGDEDRGILDQSALRVRVATIAAGIKLTYVVCGTSAIYLAFTLDRPNRPLIAVMFAGGFAAAVVASRLPAEQIVRSRFREAFFLGWSLLDLGLIIVATVADGGTKSPLALLLFMPVVFASLSYPRASVLTVGTVSVAGYLALAVTLGGSAWGYEELFAVMLACTCAMSSWQARIHERQRLALMDVSRADPLTGCLNRRGFEERANAELGMSVRRASQGAVMVLDVDHFKDVNDRHGHAAGDELLRWVVKRLRETVRAADAIGRLGGDEFAVLFADMDHAGALDAAVRIRDALGQRAPCSIGIAGFPMDGIELEELLRQADTRLYASRHGRPDRDSPGAAERLSWAATLAHAVDMRIDARHEHSRAVANCAVIIGEALGWSEDMLRMLRMAAMLHDVGKVTVPDSILSKPGPLTEEELKVIRGHSAAGAELVSRVEGLDMIVPWIRHAHESYDGSGYPDGLAGEAIPQASRIMLVADAFDAITSTRAYSKAMPVTDACEELRRNAGSQFDPRCVRVLLERLGAEPASAASSLALA